MSHQKHQTIEFLSKCKVRGKVLDIGGGEAPVKDKIRNFRAKEYRILDIGKEFNPDFVCDINKKLDFCPIPMAGDKLTKRELLLRKWSERFDWVFFLGTSSYVWDIRQAFQNAYNFLKEGGRLVTNGIFLYPYHDKEEYTHYTPHGFLKILESAESRIYLNKNFKIKRKRYFKLSRKGFKHYKKMCGAEGMFMHPDCDHKISGVIVECEK